jgi:cysteine-rich repeat protein
VLLFGAIVAWLSLASSVLAATLPFGFQDTTVFSGLTQPTAFKFASDGRVFVAEKSGLIKVFDSLTDPTPTVFADFRTNVHNYWDRGLLGLALDPNFPATPYVYILYTLDAAPGGTPPRWGTPGATSDNCPDPPGATTSGCVVGGRLSKLQASGDVMTGSEQVLLENWCQQFPSHSIGSLAFGRDGALYVTGGEGASFDYADYGQSGSPVNPCGDPPAGAGGAETPPTSEGGALRSQDVRSSSDPISFDGALLRVDPSTGAAMPDNPLVTTYPAGGRIIAYGLRNPFRMISRPGTDEIWIGDVGANDWEEIDRVGDGTDQLVENFGWPCYEGIGPNPAFQSLGLSMCQSLYGTPGSVTDPYLTYEHNQQVIAGESCGTGSSSISGLAFYATGSYPDIYNGALFFADYSRSCIWALLTDGNGDPDPNTRVTFDAGAAAPVDLQIGPGGDLFYADLNGGTIRRITYTSNDQPPLAFVSANRTDGPTPLTVQFDGSGSFDPDAGDTISYSWDLNGDGTFGDSTAIAPTRTYSTAGTYTVKLRVTDSHGASSVDTITITAGNSSPTATINTPLATTKWNVGSVIGFSGSATDPEQGTLPASGLSWTLIVHHCPSNCHTHTIQTFAGVASGSFPAPDHSYPSFLELQLTATDAGGLTDTKSVLIYPNTVDLTFNTVPTGLTLSVNQTTGPAPFTSTVIVNSANSLAAASPQTLGGTSYAFVSWSDGGARVHNITASGGTTSYTANFGAPGTPTATATPARTATPVPTLTPSATAATPTPTPGALCGNGVLDAGEQCDDGNSVSGDCCSSGCQIESTPCNLTRLGTITALDLNPIGTGNKNPEVIRDGDKPPVGTSDPSRQYDTYHGTTTLSEDWIGYTYASTQTFSRVVFQEGMNFNDGGWFDTLAVQVRKNGVWTSVSGLTSTPVYPANDGINYESYTLDFPPVSGDGIRIDGQPGGTDDFFSVGELEIYGGIVGVQPTPTPTPTPGPNLALQAASIIARVTVPTGTGNKSLQVIRDGDKPPVGNTDSSRQYDTWDGANTAPEDWIGYTFASPQTFTRVVFQEGKNFNDGGWFDTLTVQVRQNGVWTNVTGLASTPAYPPNDGINYETYSLTFTPTTGDGIRLDGAPGGSADFISVGELEVYGSAASGPTVTPAPTGTPVATATRTATPVATATRTATPLPTATPTRTATPVPTVTATSTVTPLPTATATLTVTPVATDTASAVATPSATLTIAATPTPTVTPLATATATDTPLTTVTPTVTPLTTATATITALATATATATRTSTPVLTTTPTRTATPLPSATATPGSSTCGNGVLDAGEQCDDGNAVGGDCCSATCQIESTPCTLTPLGTIVARVTNPTGTGNKSLEVIRDGDRPPVGNTDSSRQYDTYDGANSAPEDWIGYTFPSQETFSRVVFQEGKNFNDGGWFNTLTVQVRRNGVWTAVSGLTSSPVYPANDGINYETYTLSFPPVSGDGIRIDGAPGGSDAFISVGELQVYGGFIGVRPTPTPTATPGTNLALQAATIVARVTAPTGSGNKSLEVIRDGDKPPVGNGDPSREYDTWDGANAAPEDWIGYIFSTPYSFNRVVFQEGISFWDGGWFDTLTVQVRQNGIWTNVANLTITPAYPVSNDGISYNTYALGFAPITGDGIRIDGAPGGSADFISVGELEVYGPGS